MNILLPYMFDTTRAGRVVLYGMWGFALAITGTVFLLMRGVIPEDIPQKQALDIVWMALWFADIILAAFGYICFRNWAGAKGRIDARMITITPDRFFGLRSKALEGTFPLTDYRGLQVIEEGLGYTLKITHKRWENPPRPEIRNSNSRYVGDFVRGMSAMLDYVQKERMSNIALKSSRSHQEILDLADALGQQVNLPVLAQKPESVGSVR